MIENIQETKIVHRKLTKEGKLLNQYLKIKKIGEGPYSKIKLMRNINDGKFYAMKKYNLFILKKKNKLLKKEKGQAFYTNAAEEVLSEVRILKMVSHPNIARLVEIIEDQEEEKIYLFLQYCANGEIAEWSPKTEKFTMNKALKSVADIQKAFIEIAQGLAYLHANNIIHRDIKPQNILIDSDMRVKLIDFGRAIKLEKAQQKLKGSEGTYHFMAPEMLSEVYPEGYDGKRCDMWSLGVTFYAILFQKLPFYHDLLIKLFEQIEKCQYKFPEQYNKEYAIFIPIIERLLKAKPHERLTAEQLITQLKKI